MQSGEFVDAILHDLAIRSDVAQHCPIHRASNQGVDPITSDDFNGHCYRADIVESSMSNVGLP
jgi:hypothetical protein